MRCCDVVTLLLILVIASVNLYSYLYKWNLLRYENHAGITGFNVVKGFRYSNEEKEIIQRIYKMDNQQLNIIYKSQQKWLVEVKKKQFEQEQLVKQKNQSNSVKIPVVSVVSDSPQSVYTFSKPVNEIAVMPEHSIFNTLYSTSIQTQASKIRNDLPIQDAPVTTFPHVKDRVIKLSPSDKLLLSEKRVSYTPSPFQVATLREAFSNGLPPSYTFDNRPRSDFYTISNANSTETMPLLMDTFSYCIGSSLYLEVIFNLQYMYKACGREKTRKALNDEWFAVYGTLRANNMVKVDTHKHSIVTSFSFPESCTTGNHIFFVYSKNTHYNYTFTAVHIPEFTKEKYYLAACTSIDKSHPNQVKAWINHNYFHGVEHITIYLNDRVSSWHQHLDSYVKHGFVDLVEYTYPRHRTLFEQPSALNACNRRYRFTASFVIYNDVDEYFLPINETWRIVDVVRLYDELYPTVAAFRVYNTFHGCKNYSYSYWDKTFNMREICPYRYEKVIRDMRWKNIIRPSMTPIVQVHHISYGISMFMDNYRDMVMLHFKMGMHKKPQIPYSVNSEIEQAMRDIL